MTGHLPGPIALPGVHAVAVLPPMPSVELVSKPRAKPKSKRKTKAKRKTR